jgi:Domain of unknown function (DUF4388)
MASLEGTLDLFALPDVLRLLGGTGTSGALRLTDGDREGRVWLDAGRITWVAARPWPRPLVTRLHRQGGVDPAALAAAIGTAGVGIGPALTAAGAITAAALAELLREHADDELADLVRWRRGSFHFEPGQAGPETLDEPREVAEALAEAASRQAAVDAAAAELGPDARLAVPARPPGGPSVTVTADQWALLWGVRAGPGATVAELVAAGGLGELRTRTTLAAMVAAGLLTVVGQAGPADEGEALLAEALAAVDPAGAGPAPGTVPPGERAAAAPTDQDMVERLVAGVRGL